MNRPVLTLSRPLIRSRELLAEAIELLQQVMRDDPNAKAHITVWLLARRDDGTLAELMKQRR